MQDPHENEKTGPIDGEKGEKCEEGTTKMCIWTASGDSLSVSLPFDLSLTGAGAEGVTVTSGTEKSSDEEKTIRLTKKKRRRNRLTKKNFTIKDLKKLIAKQISSGGEGNAPLFA